MRFFRVGIQQQIRKLLDAREALPTDYEPQVQASIEARGIRPWEEFDERIVRWWTFVSVGAVAAENAGVVIAPDVANMPRGALWTLEWYKAYTGAASTILVQVGATPGGFAGGNVRYADNRWGPVSAGVVAPLLVSFGTDPATSGISVWFNVSLATAVDLPTGPDDWPGYVAAREGQNIAFWNQVQNQSLSVAAGGRVILP